MKIYDNGILRDFTQEEMEAHALHCRRIELMKKSRPFTEAEVTRMLITQQINTLEVDDNTALRMKDFYPKWAEATAYSAGFKVHYNNRLWRCITAHTSQVGWEPENAASIWEGINETHLGTINDPIPYEGNMVLEANKYYSQDAKVYLCTRDTINPIYNALADLIGLYVEEA